MKQRSQLHNEIKEFFPKLMRAILGYKYKIVYTELQVNGSFKKRFMAKLPLDADSNLIMLNLPKVNGTGYINPVTIFYARTDKNVNQRFQLLPSDATGNFFITHFR